MRQIIILLLMTLSACVTVRHGNVSSSGIDLNEEYQVVDIMQGISVNLSVLGINEGGKDAMILDARKNLYANYSLKPYQQFANFSVDFKTTYVLFFKETKVIVSADVIESRKDSAINLLHVSAMNYSKENEKNIELGDTIYYASGLAKVLKINSSNGRVTIGYFNNKDAFKTKVISFKSAWNYKKQYLNIRNYALYKHSEINSDDFETLIFKASEMNNEDFIELTVPENPKNKIVSFKRNDKIYKGELIEENHGAYLIVCISKSGKRVGFLIGKEDIIEE